MFWWLGAAVAIVLVIAALFIGVNLLLDGDIDRRAKGRDDD